MQLLHSRFVIVLVLGFVDRPETARNLQARVAWSIQLQSRKITRTITRTRHFEVPVELGRGLLAEARQDENVFLGNRFNLVACTQPSFKTAIQYVALKSIFSQ